MSHHALDLLPFELWLHVAECSADAWFRLACSLSCVGRYSSRANVQTRAMARFCSSAGILPNGVKHGMHVEVNCRDYKSHRWYRNGNLHRDGDLPAVKRYHEDGILCYEAWYRNGDQHRDDGDLPADKSYHDDGSLRGEAWYRNGVRHRDGDLPAVQRHYSDGTVDYEAWYRNGLKHRDGDLPAQKDYREDGTNVKYQAWYRKGVLHRDDGHAAIWYHRDGAIRCPDRSIDRSI